MIKFKDIKLEELPLRHKLKIVLEVNKTSFKKIGDELGASKSLVSLVAGGLTMQTAKAVKIRAYFKDELGIEV